MEIEPGDEILDALGKLARQSRRAGLLCASAALDDALISVFNALFADRRLRIVIATEKPSANCARLQ